MQHNQVPNAAKIRYLEEALAVRKSLNPSDDPEIARVQEYHKEVLEAILDDYKQNQRMIETAEEWDRNR